MIHFNISYLHKQQQQQLQEEEDEEDEGINNRRSVRRKLITCDQNRKYQ